MAQSNNINQVMDIQGIVFISNGIWYCLLGWVIVDIHINIYASL